VTSLRRPRLDNRDVNRTLAGIALAVFLAASFAALAEPQKALSRSERKERVKNLSDKYRQFLAEVEPIMQPEELDTFLRLESDPQRDLYVDDFWQRRESKQPGFRTRYYDRLQTAREKYRSASTDRGRIFVIHGEPAEIFQVDNHSCRLLQDLQIWTYLEVPGVGSNVRFIFFVPRGHMEYQLWQPDQKGPLAMVDLISSAVAVFSVDPYKNFDAVFGACYPGATISKLQCQCPTVADEVMRAITASEVTRDSWPKAFTPPPIDKEAVKRVLQKVVIATPGAAKLTTDVSVAFPFRHGERTDAQVTIFVPRSELVVKEVGATKAYAVDVIGEMLKDGELFEHFRYRFDYPAESAGDKLPVVVDRLLRPAAYTLRLRVSDANANREAIVETAANVPEVPRPGDETTVARIVKDIESDKPALRIVPLPDELLSGLQHIDTLIAGNVKAVEFSLDGRKIMTKRSPPYALDVDLGSVPQAHRVRAVALDEKGEPIAGDEIVVNAGNEPFRVRIVSPRLAPKVGGRTRVEMAVRVPEGKSLEKLELFLNQSRLATLYAPPFVQTIQIPPQKGVAYLRAVATLKDSDLAPVEDVVMVNTPQFMADVNVHLVELPTTTFRDGRPVNDLKESDFKVLDDGKPVTISKFEHVSNLPLSIGLAIDTSASMQPRMAEAQKAASAFFAEVMRAGDKGFVVSFDLRPQMLQDWSPNLGDLTAGLAKLRADESTALYDAIAFSLYAFVGVRGRRALVVVTDGRDTASKLSFEQALEYARRAGVPVYGIGIGIAPTAVDVRFSFGKLCGETGGNAYYIGAASDLKRIYDEIQSELRSQYVLSFYPPADAATKWHEVTVQVRGASAKTIRGYYP
jgi:VWFA-related protein